MAEDNEDDIYVTLMMDEVSIRQHTQFLPHENRHSGYITYPLQSENEEPRIAKDSLVFMVTQRQN